MRVQKRASVNLRVSFLVDSFSLGKPHMDKFFTISIRSTLYSSNNRNRLGPFKRFNNGRVNFDATNESEELESVKDDVQDLENLRQAGVPIGVDVPRERAAHSLSGSPVVTYGRNGHFNNDIEMDEHLHGAVGLGVHKGVAEASRGGMSQQQPTVTNGSSSSRIATLLPELDGEFVRLHCFVQLQLVTVIPPALSFIPNLVLGSVGRIILWAVLNALIPNFLDLVTNDYKRWVSGNRKPAEGSGSLLAPDLLKGDGV